MMEEKKNSILAMSRNVLRIESYLSIDAPVRSHLDGIYSYCTATSWSVDL